MKIGILTQPLYNNYGGLLQAFALQKVLKDMEHEVMTVDLHYRKERFFGIRGIISRIIRKYFLQQDIPNIFPHKLNEKKKKIIAQHTSQFVKKNIHTTKTICSVEKINNLKKYQFDAYIVGSDQVWRPRYSPGLFTFFLDFLKKETKIKRIAYAASFGVDQWEFTPKQTKQCATLAQMFDAISVREDSAIRLCLQYLKVEATHVLDPTMLLTKEDYIQLVENDHIPQSNGTLMTYILDQSTDKNEVIQKISNELSLIPFSVMPKAKLTEAVKNHISDCIYPPVTEWIHGFIDANYVVTDSFHGTVFSIIFNKPFITIGNHDRGMTRFTSLLKLFELEDRLIASSEELTIERMNTPINFIRVNQIKELQQKRSMEFLNKALSN